MRTDAAQAALPESARRTLCLDLLAAAGAVSIRVNDATGEIVHGCLLTPSAHRDQRANPTASLNYRNLAGSCFGCKAAGGLLWFTAVVLGTDEAGARAWLAGSTGEVDGVLPWAAFLTEIADTFARAAAHAPPRLPRYAPAALDAYAHPHPYWTDAPGPQGTGGRGLHPATVAKFHLGYDSAADRVVIPHFWRGDLVGWQTRATRGGAPGPKYKNTPAFPKRETVYGLNPEAEEIVLTESVMSPLRHAHAMDDVASTFGAQVSDEQIGQVVRSRALRRTALWFDNDEAGWTAVDGGAKRSEGLISRLGRHVPVFVVDSPFAGDPADLDTGTAEAVRENFLVPAALWRRPTLLLCPWCQNQSHPGSCPAPCERG